jgi:ankyrin repeat protein
MASKQKQREAEIALHYAIRNLRVDEVRRLLAAGVDPNAFDDKSRNFQLAFTAICTAISAAAHTISDTRATMAEVARELSPDSPPADIKTERTASLEILRLLFAAGADPNLPTLSRTPLSLAAHTGDVEVVTLLLDSGANPAGEGWSPFSKLSRPKGGLAFYGNAIHQASEKGFTEVVRLLCNRGADPLARDHEGKTARQIAIERGHTDIVRFLEQYEHSNVAG